MAMNIKDFTLSSDGRDEPAQLLSQPNVSLYCLDLEHREAVFVSTPGGIDLERFPFYYQAQFEHAERVFTVGFDVNFHSAVVAVQVPALAVVIQQPVAVTEIDVLGDFEHFFSTPNQPSAVDHQHVPGNEIAAFEEEQNAVDDVLR